MPNVQIRADYSAVQLPDGQTYRSGSTAALSENDFEALTPVQARALTLLDTAASLAQSNRVYPASLQIREVDNGNKTKTADGTTAYSSLAYQQANTPPAAIPNNLPSLVSTLGGYFPVKFSADFLVPPSGDTSGVTDAAALNAAFVAAAALPGGGVVRTRGQYYVNATVLVQGLTYWDATGTSLKQVNSANLDATVASPAAMTTGTGLAMDLPVAIVGLSLDNNRAGQTSGIGHGIFLAAGSHISNKGATPGATVVMDCVVRETRSIGICNSEVNIAGNDLTAPTGGYAGEMRFVRNRVYNCGSWGIRTQSSTSAFMFDGYCVDNVVAYTTFDGIRIDAAAGWQIDNNHVYGLGFSGVLAIGCYATRICENYIEGVGVLDSAATHFSTSSAFIQAAAYSAGTTYGLNDVVTSGGSIYRSKVDSNTGNTPASSPTQWGAQAGGAFVGGILCLASGSGRTSIVAKNQISLGHNSWALNAAFSYVGVWIQGPTTGTSKPTIWIVDNDLSNELQGAGSNTTALKLSGAGAGPSGVNPYERDNAVRGSWNVSRAADSTSGPTGAVGAGASGGTGSSCTVTGNNEAGNVSVVAGNSGLAAGILASVSYTSSRTPVPRVMLMARSAAAAALGLFTSETTTGFSINTTIAPASGATYSIDYNATMGA